MGEILKQENAQQEINFIKLIIDESRNKANETSMSIVVWGILIAVALITEFYAIQSARYYLSPWIWGIAIGGGWVYQIIDSIINKSKRKVTSYSCKLSESLWFSTGISMTILGFVGVFSGAININYLTAILGIVMASGYFVTGEIYGVNWFKNLAYGWWIGSILIFIFPFGDYNLLLFSGMMIAFQVIPGIIINKKWSSKL
jgi:hypothetical protein